MNTLKLSLLSFGILFGSAVFAQNQNPASLNKLSQEKRMELRMDHFADKLDLNADQKKKITVIRKNTILEREKLMNNQNLDNSNRGIAMKALMVKEKEQISKILTPEQARKFEAMKQDRLVNYGAKNKKHRNKKHLNKKNRDAQLKEDGRAEKRRLNSMKSESATLKN